MSDGIESSIFFMKRDELHLEQKPYAYRFAAQIDIPQSNFVLQEHHGIRVTDIRRHLEDFGLQKNGFVVLSLADEIPYEDFFDSETVKVYFRQLEALLQSHLGASKVEVFRHAVRTRLLTIVILTMNRQIRKREPSFPIATGKPYDYDQPTSVAHIGSFECARSRCQNLR